MPKELIITRTGNSKWYLKYTDVGGEPEDAIALIKTCVSLKDDDDE